MKIVFFLTLNKYEFGGGDYSIYQFAKYLANSGNEVTIFYNSNQEFFNKQFEIPTLTIIRKIEIPPLFRGCSRANEYLENIFDKFILNKYIEDNKNSIDYIIGYQTKTAIKATKIGKKYDIKIANFIFETPDWLKRQGDKEKFIEYFEKDKGFIRLWNSFKKSLLNSDVIFAISKKGKVEAEKWLNRKIDGIIFPGLDSSEVDTIQVKKRDNQIFYIGRLAKSKNIDIVINALSKLEKPPTFVVGGSGTEKEKLKSLSNRLNVKTQFRGIMTDEEKWKEYKKSLFTVFATSHEGFGNVPMESLYCKTPCITTDLEIIRDNYQDYVEYVNYRDIDDLKNKMRFLIDNLDYRKEKGEHGKEFIEKKYTLEKVVTKMENILENNLNN